MEVLNRFYSDKKMLKTLFSIGKSIYRRNASSYSFEKEFPSPLDGIKIIDLTRIVAGPFCTMVLGDLGAEVFKIEQPGCGDEARKWGPPYIKGSDATCYFVSLNRNKKSVCINLKTTEGIQVIQDLANVSDVLIENYVPGKLNKLGIGYDDLKKVAPHLIYLSLTGYGSRGPYSRRPGYDVIAGSIGGLLHITGSKDGEPCKPGVAMTDLATGLFAHGAILAALLQRTKTGLGQKIDCNLLSTQIATLINIGSSYLNAGKEAKKWGTAHENIVPYETFATADGFLTVGAGSDLQFKSLCERIGMPHLSKDSKFMSNPKRVENRNALITELKTCFASQSTSKWLEHLEGASFPYGQVNNISQDIPTLRLKLKKPKSKKNVKWGEDTVDNEHMNKKKSKCCCIYNKPRAFGESSSDSDDECDNCQGHVERRKKVREQDHTEADSSTGTSSPPLVSV